MTAGIVQAALWFAFGASFAWTYSGRLIDSAHPGLSCGEAQELIDERREQ